MAYKENVSLALRLAFRGYLHVLYLENSKVFIVMTISFHYRKALRWVICFQYLPRCSRFDFRGILHKIYSPCTYVHPMNKEKSGGEFVFKVVPEYVVDP